MKLQKNKKGVELSLNTIIIFIMALIVLIILVYFFVTHYSDNSTTLITAGTSAIDSAKSSK